MPWEKVLESPESHRHLLHLYRDPNVLAENVGQYLWEGQKQGDGLLVIATSENTAGFRGALEKRGLNLKRAVQKGQLALLDAQESLARFMIGGQPDWTLFECAVGAAIHEVRPQASGSRLRIFGDMVGMLWRARQFAAAIRLEQFWNRLLARYFAISLFCGYAIDIFGKDYPLGSLDALLSAHTHLLPATRDGADAAISRAMDEVLGSSARDLKLLIRANLRPAWAIMPFGETMALWLRNNLPDYADDILDTARRYYDSPRSASQFCLSE